MWLYDDGIRRLSVRHIELRRGIYYYRRRYPVELVSRYGGKLFKFVSLKTKDPAEATRRAVLMARQDDAEWSSLTKDPGQRTPADLTRIASATLASIGVTPGVPCMGPEGEIDLLGDYLDDKHWPARARDEGYLRTGTPPDWDRFLDPLDREMIRIANGEPKPITMSDALNYYLKEHERGEQKKFKADNHRSIGHVISNVGDLPLADYRTAHAGKIRDVLLESGLSTGTVRRTFHAIEAVFRKAVQGFDLPVVRFPFGGIKIKGEGNDAKTKDLLSLSELHAVADAARQKNDSIRHMVALLVNTGARMSEIAGLQVADMALDHEIPHIKIRPHSGIVRSLKFAGTARSVPLVGVSLWAAQQAVLASKGRSSEWLFPQYVGLDRSGQFGILMNSAATSANKWLKATLKGHKTTHCFRHTMKDRFCALEVPESVYGPIGGWNPKKKTSAHEYGQRYGDPQLRVYHRHLLKISI